MSAGSPHLHSKFVHGCFRCEISRDEAWTALLAEVEASRAKLAAIREAAEAVQCDATRKVLRILDGPTP